MSDVPRCRSCGNRLAPLDGPDWSCIGCGLIQRRRRNRPFRELSEEQRRGYVERALARERRFREAGLCPRCGGEPAPGRKFCLYHLAYMAAKTRGRKRGKS